MTLSDDAVFRTIAFSFAPATEEEWRRITAPEAWSDFIDGTRQLLGAKRLAAPGERRHGSRRAPLQEFLAEAEVAALFAPPSFAELSAFAARHFVGGLPGAALPIESLYVPWAPKGTRALTHQTGHYQSPRSVYMRDLLAALGLEISGACGAYPDHLSIEMEVLAFLLEEGRADDARQFLAERFGWLSDYRGRLVALGPTAHFHLALIDAAIGIRAHCGLADSVTSP